MALEKASGPKKAPKNEVVSPWKSQEIERKQKQARGTLRKELVNVISSKANKPKGKGCGNWAGKSQKI